VCGAGRNAYDVLKEGTGRGLWLQYGDLDATDPTSFTDQKLMRVPLLEADAPNAMFPWTKGKCYVTMGRKYEFIKVATHFTQATIISLECR
jgi:hypothetical protein